MRFVNKIIMHGNHENAMNIVFGVEVLLDTNIFPLNCE